MKKTFYPFFITAFLVLTSPLLFGQGLISYFEADQMQTLPENHQIRREYQEIILGAPVDWTAVEEKIQVQRVERHQVKVYPSIDSDGISLHFENIINSSSIAPGSYHFYSGTDGRWNSIQIDLATGPNCYLTLSRVPGSDNRINLTTTLFGVQLFKSHKVPLSLEQAAFASLQELIQLTSFQVPWEFILPDPTFSEYTNVMTFAGQVARDLNTLTDAEDGAYSADGQPVFIETEEYQDQPGLNCSGFVKWVIDIIYREKTGRGTEISEMKKKHLDSRGTSWSLGQEENRDPYFGLDWTRNLSVAVYSLEEPGAEYEDTDVNSVPWVRYVEDMGYPIHSLLPVLYYEAIKNPGNFYLGSVSKEFGENPVLHQHTHVAVLFPWIDTSGRFQVRIMERNVETPPELFVQRNSDFYLHLVRVKAPKGQIFEYLQESLKR